MLKKTLFILFITFIHFFTFAQNQLFMVIATSGSIKLIQENNYHNLKSGDKLDQRQSIILPANAYVSMIHKTGKTLELKVAGTYSVKSLVDKIGAVNQNTAWVSQYADFIIKNTIELNTQQKDYNVTGSILRSAHLLSSLPNEIHVLKNIPFSFQWVQFISEKDTFEVKITNPFDETLYKKIATPGLINLDLSKAPLNYNDPFHMLKLYSTHKYKHDKSLSVKFSLIKKSEEQKIINELKRLKEELKEENAINSLMIASFYESKGLVAYASHYLYKATQQAPNVEQYENFYKSYISTKNRYFVSELR